jgi:glutamine synthetase
MAQAATRPQDAVASVLARLGEDGVRYVDFKVTDLGGRLRHITLPASQVGPQTFREGVPFDGSSFAGFKGIEESDMLLLPDAPTAFMDPYAGPATLAMYCDIHDPDGDPYARDPRGVARRAEAHLRASGIADTCYVGPELEFFLFGDVRFALAPEGASYAIDSAEAAWSSGLPGGRGQAFPAKGAYFAVAPQDATGPVRAAIADALIAAGVPVERHHHEVGGPGQCEMNIRFDRLTGAADRVMTVKYLVKNVAAERGMAATFMPKPVYGDNGSGMHCHQSLFLAGENLFADPDGYAGLSALARSYLAGILLHGPALVAITNPTTNSYRRLVPGYEAPIFLAFSRANRSAAIRVPVGLRHAAQTRIEFRTPDASSNPYLAFAAMLMAGLDGVRRGLVPEDLGLGPVERDIYHLGRDEADRLRQVPTSLAESLRALEEDHDFLTEGGVFSEDLIEAWIREKTAEMHALDLRPTPQEFAQYFTI